MNGGGLWPSTRGRTCRDETPLAARAARAAAPYRAALRAVLPARAQCAAARAGSRLAAMVDQPPAPARQARAGRGADPWPEDLSPFRPIAKLAIEARAFTDEAAMETCERATFSPWNALPE